MRNAAGAMRRGLRELVRLMRALIRSRRRVLVGYTKAHPIYTDVLEDAPPEGFAGYRASEVRWLRPVDRYLRRRVRLVHRDAASGSDAFGEHLPLIIECEGRPRTEFLRSPRVTRVFVESRWAGGSMLDRGEVALLRPSVPHRALPRRRPQEGRELLILAVGYGALVKGFDIALRVFEALRSEFPLRLIVAGTLPHNSTYYPEIVPATIQRANLTELEHGLRTDPSIEFGARRRSEMHVLYASADVNLHFSRLETFGYSILEAMSHGLPVVATRLNAIPEMVEHGRTGYLCDPGDTDINSVEWEERVLVQAIEMTRRLLADESLRAAMGEAGRRRVAHAFNIDVKRTLLAAAYRDAMSDHLPARPDARVGHDLSSRRDIMEIA
jgi:glycosyltransferase involved in cell wall biosynthesis